MFDSTSYHPRLPILNWSAFIANEADLLNLALFGITAKEWKQQNPGAKGNLRDHATHEQLLVLSLLQGLNAKLMEWGAVPAVALRDCRKANSLNKGGNDFDG